MKDDIQAWIVDDDKSIRWVLERAMEDAGLSVRSFPGGVEMLDELEEAEVAVPDVLLTDIRMPGITGLDLLERIRAVRPELPIIIMTAHSDLDSAVAAYQGGAFEYLPKPFDVDEALQLVRRAATRKNDLPQADQATVGGGAELIGEAPAMQEVFRAIGRLSHSNITVLITGESGTGKELVAQALHEHSPRAGKPFIAVNTPAIPRELMESEFFGHERGAFTGATTQRKGRFEQADGGTLFLDEIGDMPADLQTRLLRVLADGEFYRVGGHSPIKVDVRVITATNQDLEAAVEAGRFREDLYHRLNVIRVRIPPLRERAVDIPLLLQHFLSRAAEELQTERKQLAPEVKTHLAALPWPGNVRQIENFCRWITVMAPGHEAVMSDLPAELGGSAERLAQPASAVTTVQTQDWPTLVRQWAEQRLESGADDLVSDAVMQVERELIQAALEATGGHKQNAAKRLGWGRNTLTRKLKDLGLENS